MSMGTVSARDKYLIIHTQYDQDLIASIKAIPGRRWDPGMREWRVPQSEAAAVRDLVERYDLRVAPDAERVIRAAQVATELSGAVAHEAAEQLGPIPGLVGELRPYQKVGVAYLRDRRGVLLADEMGTGKTLQALATVAVEDAWPALVVCPASLRINWARELGRFFPGRSAAVVGLRPGAKAREQDVEDARGKDITIVHYDILAKTLPLLKEQGLLPQYKALIVDEAHYIKDIKSQRGKAVQEIAKDMKEDALRILATGTPVINRPKDLIAPLKILEKLDTEFGGWRHFVERYCDAEMTKWGWDISGASNLHELEEKLRRTCYIRRTKSQVLQDLPEKVRCTLTVSMDSGAEREYIRGERLLAAARDRAEGADILAAIAGLRQQVGRGKVSAVVEHVGSLIEASEPVVVFAIHRDVQAQLYARLREAGHSVGQIIAEMSPQERQVAVDAFQGGQTAALVCSQAIAGEGLNLTRASHVVFSELGWTAASHAQAEDRAHRLGQENRVTAWYIAAAGTIDESLLRIIEEKRRIMEQTTGDARVLTGGDGPSREDVARVLEDMAARTQQEQKQEQKQERPRRQRRRDQGLEL